MSLMIYDDFMYLECFLLIKLIQTKPKSLVGGESDLNASLLDASELLLFPQPMDHHTLEMTPCFQFIFPVVKDWQRGYNQEHLVWIKKHCQHVNINTYYFALSLHLTQC